MAINHITQNYEAYRPMFVEPTPEPSFIYWLFRYRCIMCKKPATEINEIVPRARSKAATQDWRNRVTLCHECHEKYHHDGLTNEKMFEMKKTRMQFLESTGREKYLTYGS